MGDTEVEMRNNSNKKVPFKLRIKIMKEYVITCPG
jgi:hypothetical protein